MVCVWDKSCGALAPCTRTVNIFLSSFGDGDGGGEEEDNVNDAATSGKNDFRCGGGLTSPSPTKLASIASIAGAGRSRGSLKQGWLRSSVRPFGRPHFLAWTHF